MKISKITTSILWLLFAVSIFLVLLTLMGGDVEGATHKLQFIWIPLCFTHMES